MLTRIRMFPKEATILSAFCRTLTLPSRCISPAPRHSCPVHYVQSVGSSFLLWLHLPKKLRPQVFKAGLNLHIQHSLRWRKPYLPSRLSFCKQEAEVWYYMSRVHRKGKPESLQNVQEQSPQKHVSQTCIALPHLNIHEVISNQCPKEAHISFWDITHL